MTNKERKKEISKQPIPTKEECLAFYKELMNLADEIFVPYYEMAIEALEQEPRKGHWIFTKTIFDKHGCTAKCSFCHKKWKTYDEIRFKKEHNYCPNCGAKMEVEE